MFSHGFSTTNAGTGFGLAIVRTIVEAHGWVVSATESETGGARFEVRTTPAPSTRFGSETPTSARSAPTQ
ncbi:sensor histidine kinase [Salinigranum rubrum]|uniref:sensor histidine kinase n=1 Tax=Salinigranum rubrum TaxID=755307 RepID=UPI001FEA9A60|nr:ATP-binding protein [Salinigranum rubrum]